MSEAKPTVELWQIDRGDFLVVAPRWRAETRAAFRLSKMVAVYPIHDEKPDGCMVLFDGSEQLRLGCTVEELLAAFAPAEPAAPPEPLTEDEQRAADKLRAERADELLYRSAS